MSNVLTHRFVSAIADSGDATLVQPSNWNDGHKFTGGVHGSVLMRDTSDASFGASWALGPAAVATITTTGTINDYALGSVGRLRVNNATLTTITGIAAGADGQQLEIIAVGAGNVTITDQAAGSTAANRIITGLSDSLTLTAGLGIARLEYDASSSRWRTLSFSGAAWQQVAYASGNFTATGGGTWTVDSGDQIVFEYIKANRQCTVNLTLDTTSISGTVTRLNIATPVTAAKRGNCLAQIYDNSGSVSIAAECAILAGGSSIAINKLDNSALAASTNLTYIRASITFEY